jgi:hypothetical protein
LEKSDLLWRLEEELHAREERERQREQQRSEAEEQEAVRQRVVKEVEKWAKGKGFQRLLQEVLGCPASDITRTTIAKMYKK